MLVIDTEATGAINNTKGKPFSQHNKLCYIGMYDGTVHYLFPIEYKETPFGRSLEKIQRIINEHELLVGFNIKYDLHWLRRYGITKWPNVYDCQIAEWILSRQSNIFPSLDSTAKHYGFSGKLDVVQKEYWDVGIDTDAIPQNILEDYLSQDLLLTYKLYHAQKEKLNKEQKILMNLMNHDLVVLQEMEWHGLYVDLDELKQKGEEAKQELEKIDEKLRAYCGGIPINWNSPKQVASVLYGGTIVEERIVPYLHTFKDGRSTTRNKKEKIEHVMPPLLVPITRGTKVDYGTGVPVLRQLLAQNPPKHVRRVLDLLLQRSKIEQLRGTYYDGYVKLHSKMMWEQNVLHGQFHQCATTTGRLASTKPNQQNMPDPVRRLIKSRFSK